MGPENNGAQLRIQEEAERTSRADPAEGVGAYCVLSPPGLFNVVRKPGCMIYATHRVHLDGASSDLNYLLPTIYARLLDVRRPLKVTRSLYISVSTSP